MAAKSKKKKAQPKKKARKGLEKRQITALVLFFVNLFLFVAALFDGDNLWHTLHAFLMGLGGFWIFPWLVFAGAVFALLSLGKTGEGFWPRLLGVFALLWFGGAFVSLFSYSPAYTGFGDYVRAQYALGVKGAGVLGSLLAYPFARWFGRAGAMVVVCLAAVLLALLLTGTTLAQFLTAVSKPVQKASANTREAMERRRQRRSEKEWDISLEGMPEQPTNPPKTDETDLATKSRRLVAKYNDEEPADEPATPPAADLDEIIQQAQENAGLDPESGPAEAEAEAKEKPAKKPRQAKGRGEGESDFTPIQVNAAPQEEYHCPPVRLLEQGVGAGGAGVQDELKTNAELLVDTLRSFGVETRIINISRGPTVTRYELQPAAGVKISKITGLADDIALNLATAGVRIEAPIPNKAAVGIEVPNKSVASVRLRDIIDSAPFAAAKSKLTVAVGKDIAGNIVLADLAKMPHLLIAGTTGSGKSVCINSFILSVLFKASPEEVKLLMIDPKVVELEVYNGLPHLLVPVVTDPKKASGALGWAVAEMERRYKLFGECKVRDLTGYNRYAKEHEGFETMPQILIVVDELNDLMMVAPAEVEDSICRLAQKARAAGMHLVVATQRPSVDVLTGLIKANVPSRIALKVANRFDSGTILDRQGAEKLLGKGDMLFYPVGLPEPVRVQGCWVSDDEIKAVVEYITGGDESEYSREIAEEIERHAAETKGKKAADDDGGDGEWDEMLPQAMEVVVEAGLASTSLLQRRLKLGYARAARIVDQLEERGVVGPFEGSKPRKVLLTRQQLEEMRMNQSD